MRIFSWLVSLVILGINFFFVGETLVSFLLYIVFVLATFRAVPCRAVPCLVVSRAMSCRVSCHAMKVDKWFSKFYVQSNIDFIFCVFLVKFAEKCWIVDSNFYPGCFLYCFCCTPRKCVLSLCCLLS